MACFLPSKRPAADAAGLYIQNSLLSLHRPCRMNHHSGSRAVPVSSLSDVEEEVHDVAVLDDVVLAL